MKKTSAESHEEHKKVCRHGKRTSFLLNRFGVSFVLVQAMCKPNRCPIFLPKKGYDETITAQDLANKLEAFEADLGAKGKALKTVEETLGANGLSPLAAKPRLLNPPQTLPNLDEPMVLRIVSWFELGLGYHLMTRPPNRARFSGLQRL